MPPDSAKEVFLPSDSTPPPTSRASDPEQADSARSGDLSTWEHLSFSVVHRAAAILLALLGLNGLYRLGRTFGTFEWMINFKRRRRFGRALRAVIDPLSSRDRRRHTREHFMQTRCDKLYYLIFDCIPRDKAIAGFTIRNQGLLDDALSAGRGVYVALSHHGPLHVAGMLMALRGYMVAGVRDRREGAMRRYVQGLYDRKYPEFGRAKVLYADSYPREIYRCLQEGYVLGSAMDVSRVRDPQQSIHEVCIFGRPQVFLTGPLRIAMRCKTPVVQAFVLPKPNFRYELDVVELLFNPANTSDEEDQIRRSIERYARNVEAYVKAYPALLTRT